MNLMGCGIVYNDDTLFLYFIVSSIFGSKMRRIVVVKFFSINSYKNIL